MKARRSRPRSRARRAVYAALVLLLVAAAIAVNIDPALDLVKARATWSEQAQALAAAKGDVQAARQRVEELSSPSFLEVKARQDLGYVRPGEQLFVVESAGEEDATTTAVDSDAQAGSGETQAGSTEGQTAGGKAQAGGDGGQPPGFLERLLERLQSVFER